MADRFRDPLRVRSDRRRIRRCELCGGRHPASSDCPADNRPPEEPILLAPIHRACGFRHPDGTGCPPVRTIAPGICGTQVTPFSGKVAATRAAARRAGRRGARARWGKR